MLAGREAELTMKGVRFINQELLGFLPGRTLESIKGVRRRADYRSAVQGHIVRIGSETGDVASPVALPVRGGAVDGDAPLMDYFRSLVPLDMTEFRAQTLNDLCRLVGSEDRGVILERLTAYLLEVFPPPRGEREGPRGACRAVDVRLSRRRQRRIDFGRVQKLWRRNPGRCYKSIVGPQAVGQGIPKGVMVDYWETTMTAARESRPLNVRQEEVIPSLWSPVTLDEVRDSLPARNTAPGPDGVSARALRGTHVEVLCRVYNLVLWCRRLPLHLRSARTALIPKIPEPKSPADFRPISVASALVRGLHKVLARRMGRLVSLDERQRAFRATDGCADNVFLLDLVLRYHHDRHKPLHLASIDVAKAFDTVSHAAILETLKARGCPGPMLEYVETLYADSTTTISADGWHSHAIHPTQGVRQGDPMSPHIFNMVLDGLLRKLPQDIGASIDGVRVAAAAFADDLVLTASTAFGLQRLLDCAEGFLTACGMAVNVGKSFTVSLGTVPRQKKTTVDEGHFVLGGRELPWRKRTDRWEYLGVPFSPEGRLRSDPTVKLVAGIRDLTKAPLKPQQRLFALRVFLLPSVFYAASLGAVRLGSLNRCDRATRVAVRRWLDLPHDTPTAYFHSPIDSGGLGLPSLRWRIPRIRLSRLQGLRLSPEAVPALPGQFLRLEVERARQSLLDHGDLIDTAGKESRRWAKALHGSVDGAALKEAGRVPGQSRWLAEGTRFLTGRDFISTGKLRINALPTKSRTSRGRVADRNCRAGCQVPETLNHVLQVCHRTHDARIRRHDAVVAYLARGMEQRGFRVWREPKFNTGEGVRKPDIVATRSGRAVVLDAQVVSEQTLLDLAHRRKVRYYSDNVDLRLAIGTSMEVDEVTFHSATLSWRGLWSPRSASDLTALGVMGKGDIKVLSSRVLVGGVAAWRIFNRRTSVGFDRLGIG